MSNIEFQIIGIGAWGPTFQSWPELANQLSNNYVSDEHELNSSKAPKPAVIPANERRRAPLAVRLAVESSWQAIQDAKIKSEDVPCVFVSGIGDTQLTDYMCRVLAGDNKALSPTKFHNSVHNAAAGYWTISTACMQSANSVAGFQESVSLALMEGLLQCEAEQKPILLTFYDAPSSEVLKELLLNEDAFSVSIIIAPKSWSSEHENFTAIINNKNCQWPSLNATAALEKIYSLNPTAKVLALLQAVVQSESNQATSMPMSAQSGITIEKIK